MAVYVDTPFRSRLSGELVCHLSADSSAELHGFAARIGVGTFRFVRGRCLPGESHHPVFSHYLIPASLRAAAVAAGAVPESPQDAVDRAHAYERTRLRALALSR